MNGNPSLRSMFGCDRIKVGNTVVPRLQNNLTYNAAFPYYQVSNINTLKYMLTFSSVHLIIEKVNIIH